jgi:hypothetical protein
MVDIPFPAIGQRSPIPKDPGDFQGILQIYLHCIASFKSSETDAIGGFDGFINIIGFYTYIITKHIPPGSFRRN